MPISIDATIQARSDNVIDKVMCITIHHGFLESPALIHLYFTPPLVGSSGGTREFPISEFHVPPGLKPPFKDVDGVSVTETYRFVFTPRAGEPVKVPVVSLKIQVGKDVLHENVTPRDVPNPFTGPFPSLIELIEWGSVARAMLAGGNVLESIDIMVEIFQRKGGSATFFSEIDTFLDKIPDVSKRIDVLKRITTIDGKIARAWSRLAREMQSTGNTDEALATLQQAAALNPSDDGLSLALADVFSAANRADEEISILNNLLGKHPNRMDVFDRLANALASKKGDVDKLIGITEDLVKKGVKRAGILGYWHATRKDPQWFQGWISLGDACRDEGLLDDAFDAYKHALSLRPDSVKATYRLGRMLEMKCNQDCVVELYDPFLKSGQASKSIFVHLGRIFILKHNYDAALDMAKKALAIDPKSINAIATAGVALFRKGDMHALESFWAPYVPSKEIFPRNAGVMGNWLEEKIKIVGGNVDWKKLAAILVKYHEYRTCIHYLGCILMRNPEDWEASSMLASCYYETKDFRSAIKVATDSLGKFPIQPGTEIVLGFSYLVAGRYETARKTFEKHRDKFDAMKGLRLVYQTLGDQDQVDRLTETMIMNENTPITYWMEIILEPMGPETEERVLKVMERRVPQIPRYTYGRLLLGWLQARCGRREDAIRTFQLVLEESPGSIPAMLALEELHPPETGLEKLVDDASGLLYKPSWMDHVFHATFQMLVDNPGGAIRSMNSARAIAPGSARVLRQLFEWHNMLQNQDLAIAVAKDWVEIDDRNPVPWLLLGAMYFNIFNVDAAIEAYSEAVERDPGNPDPLFHLGCCWAFKGNVSESIRWFQKATRLKPNHYPALVFLQRAFIRSGMLKEAREVEEVIGKLIPPLNDYFETGYCATILKDLTIGLKNYASVLKRNKRNSAAWNNLATIHEHMGNFASAMESYQQAISINPRGFHGWHNLVYIKKNTGNVAGALDVIKEYIQKFPSSEKGWLTLGELYMDERNAAEAVGAFKHAVDVTPGLYRGWLQLGLSQLLAKDLDSVLTSCARVLDLEPRNALARALIEFVKNGITDPPSFIAKLPEPVQLRDWEDMCNGLDELGTKHVSCAVIAWSRFSERFPNFPSAWHGLGRALEKQGDVNGAERSLKRAIELQPYAFHSIVALGRVFTKKGNVPEAIDLFKHITSTYPDLIAGWTGLARACLLAEPPDLESATTAIGRASKMRADDPGVMYVNAIHAVKTARVEESLGWLEKLVARDAELRHEIAGDVAFKSVRENSGFQALIRE